MADNPQQIQISSDPIKARFDKLNILKDMGRDPFVETTSNRDITCAEVAERFDELEEKTVTIAGRIMSKRGKGKVSFLDLHDRSGKLQIFAKKDDLGEELADVVIYLLGLSEILGIDLEDEIQKKVYKNSKREYKIVDGVNTRIKEFEEETEE